MTTYPLSEPATIYAVKDDDAGQEGIAGRGSLDECAEIIEAFPEQKRRAARIEMDDLDLRYGPAEIAELLRFLRQESPGLSNNDIAAIADTDR